MSLYAVQLKPTYGHTTVTPSLWNEEEFGDAVCPDWVVSKLGLDSWYLINSLFSHQSKKHNLAKQQISYQEPPTPWCFMIPTGNHFPLSPSFLLCRIGSVHILSFGPRGWPVGEEGLGVPLPLYRDGHWCSASWTDFLGVAQKKNACSSSSAHDLSKVRASWALVQWNESRCILLQPLTEACGLSKVLCNLHRIHVLLTVVESFDSVYFSLFFSP